MPKARGEGKGTARWKERSLGRSRSVFIILGEFRKGEGKKWSVIARGPAFPKISLEERGSNRAASVKQKKRICNNKRTSDAREWMGCSWVSEPTLGEKGREDYDSLKAHPNPEDHSRRSTLRGERSSVCFRKSEHRNDPPHRGRKRLK